MEAGTRRLGQIKTEVEGLHQSSTGIKMALLSKEHTAVMPDQREFYKSQRLSRGRCL